MSDTTYDLLVIGAGSSGLAAATAAAQSGARVAVVDKAEISGGPNRVNPSSLGMFAVGTRLMKEKHVDVSVEDAFRIYMDHSNWKVDGRTVSALVRGTAPTIEWLESMGVHFVGVEAYFTGAKAVWHLRDHPERPVIADALEAEARRHGAEFFFRTTALELLQEDGRVVGARVEGPDGGTAEIRAVSTVLAAGGYQGNPAMIEELTGLVPGRELFTFFMFTHEVHQGEGLRMAWEAGAARSETMLETYIYLPDPHGGPGGTSAELGVLRQPGLMVNQLGLRFTDESIVNNPADAANVVRRQPGSFAYMVVSDAIDQDLREHGFDVLVGPPPRSGRIDPLAEQVPAAIADGYPYLFAADTLEELAEQLEVPVDAFLETVEEYDRSCARGVDTQFFKPAESLRPIGRDGRYYAAKFYLGSYGSSGGIAINDHGQAVDEHQRPVPGLYATGRDANDVYGGTYPFVFAGSIQAFSYTMGRITGLHAAESARSPQRTA